MTMVATNLNHECSEYCIIKCDICRKTQCIDLLENDFKPVHAKDFGHICFECLSKKEHYLLKIKNLLE